MGQRGIPPTPTALRLVTGVGSHHNHNDNSPDTLVPKVLPECPDWLIDDAKVEWEEIVAIMSKVPGWLTQVNKTTLAGHCQWYAVWKNAEETLSKEGRVFDTILGQDETGALAVGKKIHPMVRVAKEAWIAMIKCDQELGITPARGSAVKLPAGERDDETGLDSPGRTG